MRTHVTTRKHPEKNSGGCANRTETTCVGNRRDERGHPDPMATTPLVVYLVIPIPCGQSPLHAPLNDWPIVVVSWEIRCEGVTEDERTHGFSIVSLRGSQSSSFPSYVIRQLSRSN